MKTHKFNPKNYNLYEKIQEVFECNSVKLEELHHHYHFSAKFNMSNNSDTALHDRFYHNIRNNNDIIEIYDRIVEEVVSPILGEDFIYQKMPTLRVHFVNNWATPEFHVDTQEGYNHPYGENNFILPLTTCRGTNSVWVESEPNKGDFSPVEISYGELFQFNGGELRHGNKINTTEQTRVSLDFRVLPISKYDENYAKKSATTGKTFTVGSYYKKRIILE